ncbi:MAG TPA: FAD-dependent oxidoreductase [Anaerolineae bacterium]|nr:FAD-dependent oxidoreductase [Anaerolineae bacterium]HNU04183.1 FAD-dependent oxidoreductase [Anaerolineae bacterium]
MSAKLVFDAIVVGAGPAGVAAAITMARGGLRVILLERGRFAGAKNFFGGVLYTHALAEVLPDYWQRKPPFERPVTEQGYWLLSPDSVVRFMHKSEHYKQEPAEAYTALRAPFDAWFAEQAVREGVLLITKTTVIDLLRDGQGRVIGVSTDRPEGDVYAPIVILAEGVNNLLTQKLGLAGSDLPPRFVALSVKELIGLPAKEIETRFGLAGAQEGVAIDIFGDATLGLPGTAFIYSDKKAISIGVGLLLEEFIWHNLRPYEVLARFKAHPVVRPYLEGGESLEYGAHLIPEQGYDRMPELAGDGVLVAGDAACMVDALHREGTNLAMTAGRMAGETALEAHRQNDFSAAFLRAYRRRLEESFVLKDLKQYRRMTDFLDSTPHFMGTYINFVNDAAMRFFSAHGMPKRQMEGEIFGLLRQRRSFFGMAQDAMKLLRGMRG